MLSKLPQAELIADKGYEILYFTDEIDEFAIKVLMTYKDKEFKNISSLILTSVEGMTKPNLRKETRIFCIHEGSLG